MQIFKLPYSLIVTTTFLTLASTANAGKLCKNIKFTSEVSKSQSNEVGLDIGGRVVHEYNNADGVVGYYVAGPKVSPSEARAISNRLDQINDNFIDASKILVRPKFINLYVNRTGADAFWSRRGSAQLKTVLQFALTTTRAGSNKQRVQKNIEKDIEQINKKTKELIALIGPEEAAKVRTELIRKLRQGKFVKNPKFSVSILDHEYGHVILDTALANRFPRLKAMENILIHSTKAEQLEYKSREVLNLFRKEVPQEVWGKLSALAYQMANEKKVDWKTPLNELKDNKSIESEMFENISLFF